jgi:hypothetical protein
VYTGVKVQLRPFLTLLLDGNESLIMNISLCGTVLGNNAMKFGAVSLTTVSDGLLLSFASASFSLV